jgi:hypothetical protein
MNAYGGGDPQRDHVPNNAAASSNSWEGNGRPPMPYGQPTLVNVLHIYCLTGRSLLTIQLHTTVEHAWRADWGGGGQLRWVPPDLSSDSPA